MLRDRIILTDTVQVLRYELRQFNFKPGSPNRFLVGVTIVDAEIKVSCAQNKEL